jgi:hypothetical protein
MANCPRLCQRDRANLWGRIVVGDKNREFQGFEHLTGDVAPVMTAAISDSRESDDF